MELPNVMAKIRQILRFLFIVIVNMYCIPTYLIWMWVVFLPFRIINHPSYWYIEGVLYNWLHGMVASWSWTAQYYIMEIGDDMTPCIGQRSLLLVNHQSTSDVPMLMHAFYEKETVLHSLMWIMDRMFRYTNFGAVAVTHGDYFITQGKNVREEQARKLIKHLFNIFLLRDFHWIVLFPEGGFLSKRRETSSKYAKENNFPDLQRVTLPRIGAIQMIMDTLHPNNLQRVLQTASADLLLSHFEKNQKSLQSINPIKWVVDVTIAYPDGDNPLDLLTICTASRPPCTTYIYYRLYPVEDVPMNSSDALRDWVYERWVEKEKLLQTYYETGKFPHLNREQCAGANDLVKPFMKHQVTLNNVWIGFLHVFFLSSSLLHCYILRRLWSFIF